MRENYTHNEQRDLSTKLKQYEIYVITEATLSR